MLSTFYRDKLKEAREREINDALSQGLLTPEQAASALGKRTPDTPGVLNTPPPTQSSGGSIQGGLGATPSLPSFEEQEQMMRAEIERRHATMRPPRITLSQSLDDLISKGRTPDTSYSKLDNYKQAREKLQPYHDLAFQSLSPGKQQNILERISKNVPIDTAFQKGYGNMMLSMFYEMTDAPNRLWSFLRGGAALPEMKAAWDKNVESHGTFLAPLKMVWDIGVGTVTGFVGGIGNIATGEANLEDITHVASMLMIPFTAGISAVGGVTKAAQAMVIAGHGQRVGRVYSSLTRLQTALKRSAKPGPYPWGGFNVRNWGKMGGAARFQTAAELSEYIFNPDEVWYEIIGDIGIGAALKGMGKGSTWIRERLATPEKQMQAQERGLEKRFKRVEKMDAQMAAGFRNIYENIAGQIGTEATQERIEALDQLINRINYWEASMIASQLPEGMTEEEAMDFFLREASASIFDQAQQAQEQEAQGGQEATPDEGAGDIPQTAQDEPQPQQEAQPEQEEQGATPDEGAGSAERPETDLVRTFSDIFGNMPLSTLEVEEIDGVNQGRIEQDSEEGNRAVRIAIEEKARQIYSQGESYITARAEAQKAAEAAEADPENADLQRDANEAAQRATDALENLQRVIAPSAGQESETNEQYIADPVERARHYHELGQRFLGVAADLSRRNRLTQDGTERSPEAAQEHQQAEASIVQGITDALAQEAGRTPTGTEPQPEPEPEQEEQAPTGDPAPEAETIPQEAEPEPEPEPEPQPEAEAEAEPEQEATPQEEPPRPAAARSGSNQQRVLDAIDSAPEGLGVADIQNLLSGSGAPLSGRQIARALSSLREKGAVVVTGKGIDTRYARKTEPEAQPEPEPEAEQQPQEEPQEELPIKEPGEPEAEEEEREIPETPKIKVSSAAGNKILDRIRQQREEQSKADEEDDGWETLGSSFGQENQVFEALRNGELSVSDVEGDIAALKEQIAELEAKDVRTETEAETLRELQQTVALFQEGLEQFQEYEAGLDAEAEEQVAGSVDNTLYFNYESLRGPFRTLSTFFADYPKIGGQRYTSVEHYMLSMKFANSGLKMWWVRGRDGTRQQIPVSEGIRRANTAEEAWKIANKYESELTPEQLASWEQRRNSLMREALLAKYASPQLYKFDAREARTLADWLLATGDRRLLFVEPISTNRETISNAEPVWGVNVTPQGVKGKNELGRHLMLIRQELKDGKIPVPTPADAEPAGQMPFADLPPRMQSAAEALGIDIRTLYLHNTAEMILNKAAQGNLVFGIAGSQRNNSSFSPEGETEEQARQKKIAVATRLGWITDASEWNQEIEARIDAYNKAEEEGAKAAAALAGALNEEIAVTDGTFGTGREVVKTVTKQKRGNVLVAMPGGIEKRATPFSRSAQYQPNVPEIDDANAGAISMHPTGYDANEVTTATGSSPYRRNNFQKNALIASLSHVTFITHASHKENDLAVDTALKSLQAGRPVVILDPALFDSPLEGSEYLATLPGVIVLKDTKSSPLVKKAEHQVRKTGKIETTYAWNGTNLLKALKEIATLTHPSSAFAEKAYQDLETKTADWTEGQLQDRIGEIQSQLTKEGAIPTQSAALRASAELRILNRLLAARHPAPTTSSEFEYVTPLDAAERSVTGGLIGLRNYENFETFYRDLKASGVKVFVDVRMTMWDRQRNPQTNALENSWSHAERLRESFRDTDIKYVAAHEFTPSQNDHAYQLIIDRLSGITRTNDRLRRGGLDPAFTVAYHNYLRKTQKDLGMFLKDMIRLHIAGEALGESAIAFGALERESRASHRSILGEIMHDVLGMRVVDIQPGGLTEVFDPVETAREVPAPPPDPIAGRSEVRVTKAMSMYAPKAAGALALVDLKTDTEGTVQQVIYRHAHYPGFELMLRRGPEDIVQYKLTTPRTQEADLSRLEAEMTEGAAEIGMKTAFPSELGTREAYSGLVFGSEDFPVAVEHLFRSLAPGVVNPGIYGDSSVDSVESHPNDPLIPVKRRGNLKYRVVNLASRDTEQSGLAPPQDVVTRGEYAKVGEQHHTRDEDQTFSWQEENVPYATIPVLTEKQVYHYYLGNFRDIEVRLSVSGKYLSVVTPQNKNLRLPLSFPLNIRLQMPWSDFSQGWESENEALYEYLWVTPHLWRTDVTGETERVSFGTPVDIKDLSVADLVFKGYTIKEKQRQWDLIKSFITRYQTSRTDARPTEAEIAAVRQFVLRLPDPPNILTQVENYLKSIRREMQRLTPQITSVPVPQTVEYSPETIQTVLLSEITNQGVGSMDDIDLDNPDFAQDQAEAEGPDTATDEEVIEAGERPPDADEDAEDDGEVVEDPRSPKAQIRSLAGRVAATGVPRASQIDEIYAPQWFDTYEMVINAPENGFDVLWNDGSIPATAEVMKKGRDGKWRATGERRGAGLSEMAGDTAHMLGRLAENTEDTVKRARLMQLAADLEAFTPKNEDFSMMSLWEPEGVALKQLLNILESAFVELRGLDAFKLKGVVLTNLPLSAFQKNLETLEGERPRSDMVLTNTGKLVPASAMHEYVVIPEKKQVFRRPSTQLRMAVASMEETDADGTKRESTRFYIDRTKGTQFEVIQDSDTEVQVAMLGSDLTIRFKKGETGEVTIENRKEGTISDKVFVTNWQTGPLNTTDALRRAIAPIAMVMRDGFSLSGNIPLQLARIDMGGQGAWRFELGDTVAFDLGADGVVESPDYNFTVQVVPTESGFRYRIDAFRGDEAVTVFRDANGTPHPAVTAAIETPDGQPRSPHEAISYLLWFQREAAAEKGWDLPKTRPVGQRVEVQEGKPPAIVGWREADTDPNNILIEDWKDWSRDIAFVFGAELTQAIETAVFASETPLYTRLDVYEALVDVVNREVMDSLDAQRTVAQLRWAVPSLLRRRLEAQNTWTPTDKNWVEQHYDHPVVRRYVHQEYEGYVVEFLEGSGVAKVFYNGVVLEEIDYADARSLWEYVGRKFVNTVRGHTRRMIEAGSFGNYNIRREVNDDVVWELSDERRVRFPAIERAAILEVYRNGNWETERRAGTRVVITDLALERQLAFVKMLGGRGNDRHTGPSDETTEEMVALYTFHQGALRRKAYARYTGPVRRLPRDIEDTQYYAGKDTPPVDHIQRYAIEGESIEMHLLLTDRADDRSQANFPSPVRHPEDAEKFRRVAFFDTERGSYVRREGNEWVPDPTTFEAEPLRGFEHRRQTSELPVDVQSETPGESSREATEIDNERKAAIQAERAHLRRTTPWLLVDGVSESYILSTLENLYHNTIREQVGARPGGVQSFFPVDIKLSYSPFIETAESESAIAQELEARHTRFLQGVKAFNEEMVQSGQSTLAQSSTGLTPDGVALRVPNRNDAMQSTGFVNGVRVYESGRGLRIAIAQSAPDTFIASVTHAASGASLTIRDINASGFKKRNTARSYMDPLVLEFYEAEGYMGESGEAEILANAFDSAALSAIETFHRFADHYNKDRFFEKNVTVEYFVENAFDVEPPLSDRRMERYRNELKEELDAETRATVLENLQELVDQKRALQNGLETSVSNYRRLLKSLETELARSGSEEVQRVYNRWGIRRLVFPGNVGEGSPVGREALLNAIDTHVSNDVLRKSLREVVDSLESQMRRITRSYPAAIRDVNDAIWRLKGEYFKDAPYRPAVSRGQRRQSQNVLNTLLQSRGTRSEHVADGLTLDPETFDTASLTHSVTISDTALAQELRARREEIVGASPIAEQTQAEGVTVEVDGTEHRAIRASYRVTNNPFIRINAVSQSIEGSPATETQEAVAPREEILLVVEPRMRIGRQNGIIFSLEVENSTDGEGTRIERLPRIVESFAQANYATLSAWLNPVHRGHIRVKELSSGETVYQITDDLQVSVRQVGNGQWQVEMPFLEQRDTDPAEQIEALTEELDPADYDMIENLDLFRAEPGTVPQGIDYNTNFVLASSAYDALQKVILQKLANRETSPALYRAIEPALQDVMFDDIRGRIATRFAEQTAGVDTAVGASREIQIGDETHEFVEVEQEDIDGDFLGSRFGQGEQRKFVIISGVSHELTRDTAREDTSRRATIGTDAEHITSHKFKEDGSKVSSREIYDQIRKDGKLRGGLNPEEVFHRVFFSHGPHYRLNNVRNWIRLWNMGPRHGDAYRHSGLDDYGFILDLQKLVADHPSFEAIVSMPRQPDRVAEAGMGKNRITFFDEEIEDARTLQERLSVQGRDVEHKTEILIGGDVDINKYLIGVVEGGKVFVKPEHVAEPQVEQLSFDHELLSSSFGERETSHPFNVFSQWEMEPEGTKTVTIGGRTRRLVEVPTREETDGDELSSSFGEGPGLAKMVVSIGGVERQLAEDPRREEIQGRGEKGPYRDEFPIDAEHMTRSEMLENQDPLREIRYDVSNKRRAEWRRLEEAFPAPPNYITSKELFDEKIEEMLKKEDGIDWIHRDITKRLIRFLTEQGASYELVAEEQGKLHSLFSGGSADYIVNGFWEDYKERLTNKLMSEREDQFVGPYYGKILEIIKPSVVGVKNGDLIFNKLKRDLEKKDSAFKRYIDKKLFPRGFGQRTPIDDLAADLSRFISEPEDMRLYRKAMGIPNQGFAERVFTSKTIAFLKNEIDKALSPKNITYFDKIKSEGRIAATYYSSDEAHPEGITGVDAYLSFGPYYRLGDHGDGFILNLEKILEDIPGIRATLHVRGKWGDRTHFDDINEIREVIEDHKGAALNDVVEIRVPQDIDINEYLIGVVEDGKTYVLPEYHPDAPTETDTDELASSFVTKDEITGEEKTEHPFGVVPVGVEDFRHPQMRAFIAQEIKSFADTFNEMEPEARIEFLQTLVAEWQGRYAQRAEADWSSPAMVQMRDFYARSPLTAWVANNAVDYESLLTYGAALDATRGEPSAALVYRALDAMRIGAYDSVRIEDAGDGLVAAMIPNAPATYVDASSMRRSHFSQMFPDLEIAEGSSNTPDVLMTSNSARQSPSELIESVHRDGRVAIYGDSDWHHIAYKVLEKLHLYESVEEFEKELPQGIDDATRDMYIKQFGEWKAVGNRPIAALHFNGGRSAYTSETGILIVMNAEEQASPTLLTEQVRLTNLQEQPVSAYQETFENVQRFVNLDAQLTEAAREQKAAERQQREAARKIKEQPATKAINTAITSGRQQIFATYPAIKSHLRGLGHAARNRHLIPRKWRFDSLEELAALAEIARSPQMVTTQVLLVNNGEIQASVLGGIRSSTDVRPTETDVADLMPVASTADHDVVVVINRPSGDTSVEQIDVDLMKSMAERYPGFQYLFIKNGDTYSVVAQTPEGETAIRQNMQVDVSPSETFAAETVSAPAGKWGDTVPEPPSQAARAMHEDFNSIREQHLEQISQIADADDNWAVVALLDAEGNLIDIVEIPNAFDLDEAGAGAAIERIQSLYGAEQSFLFLGSTEQITNNPDFFSNTGWGTYLSGEPNLNGHVLTGQQPHHPDTRIRTYPAAASSPAEMRRLAKSTAPAAFSELSGKLSNLLTQTRSGNLWEAAKAAFLDVIKQESLARTESLTLAEEMELRHHLNVAVAAFLQDSRYLPAAATRVEAEAAFVELTEWIESWNKNTAIPLNGARQTLAPQYAYLMHYLADIQPDDIVVVPNADTGVLASFKLFQGYPFLTESDVTRRAELRERFGTVSNMPAEDLANAWQQDPNLRELQPGVVLLDVKEPEAFWQQLNQALHTVKPGGRVVAHANIALSEAELQAFREASIRNIGPLREYYQLRMFITHEQNVIIVVDRTDPAGRASPFIKETAYASPAALLDDAEKVRMQRRAPAPQETGEEQSDPEIPESAPTPDPDTKAEAEAQSRNTKPQVIDISKTESHREWVERLDAALPDQYSVSSVGGARALYEQLMETGRSVPLWENGAQRSDAEVRADIEKRWHDLLGFTPEMGWEQFLLRLTAAYSASRFNPDTYYRMGLYELLDPQGTRDIQGILDPRTNEVDRLLSTSYRMSQSRPIRLIGEQVVDAEDAAILFQPFRNPAHETVMLIGVDADGKVVKVQPQTQQRGLRSPAPTPFAIQRFMKSDPNIVGFWVAHNHPEHAPNMSSNDSNKDAEWKQQFGDAYKGFVVTDTGEFSSVVDGEVSERQTFSKPIEDVYLERPELSGALGALRNTTEASTSMEAVADAARHAVAELETHPDMVTFVITAPRTLSTGGRNQLCVVATETYKNLHTLSAAEIEAEITRLNTAHGAYKTFMVAHNPSDPSLYGAGGVWNGLLQTEDVVISDMYVDTDDASFPYSKMNRPQVAIGRAILQKGRPTPVQVDAETGEVFEAEKQSKFAEFVLFEYFSQNVPVNWRAMRAYADTYFDKTLTDTELRGLVDIAFDEYIKAMGIRLDPEMNLQLTEHLYKSLVDPEIDPFTAGDRLSENSQRYLDAMMLRMESGETLDASAALLTATHPVILKARELGLHLMNENLNYAQHQHNITEPDPRTGQEVPRTPTLVYQGMAAWSARGGSRGTGENPMEMVFQKLTKLAPRGRMVLTIEGGLYGQRDSREGADSRFVQPVGAPGLRFSVPVLSKLFPAYVAERAGEISIEERNKRWGEAGGGAAGLSQAEAEYYHNTLGELFNANKYSVRAFIRLGEHKAHLVVDKVPETGEHGTDISINPAPDRQTMIEKYLNLRAIRPKVSSRDLRRPVAIEAKHAVNEIRKRRAGDALMSPLSKEATDYQTGLMARTGRRIGVQPRLVREESEYGAKSTVETDELSSSFGNEGTAQIRVTGLNNQIDRKRLEAIFAQHGDVINVLFPHTDTANNSALVFMRSGEEAAAAIAQINGSVIDGVRLDVSAVARMRQSPIESLPQGVPTAWRVLLSSQFLPEAIRQKFMRVLDIQAVADEAGERTYLRDEKASVPRKLKEQKDRFWQGRGGQALSRPIEHIQRWGVAGQKLAELMTDVYYNALNRGNEGFYDVRNVYKSLRLNPTVAEALRKGSTEKIFSSQMGFLPVWVKKVPGIKVWVDEKHDVERAVFKGKVLTQQDASGQWYTQLFLSNAPLLDAWVSAFWTQGPQAIFPRDEKVREILGAELLKVRQMFDRQDQELILANYQILKQGLLTPQEDELEDITDALNNNDLNKGAIRAYADKFGIELPEDFDVFTIRQKRGTMRQWIITPKDENRELYRIRQFDEQQSVIGRLRHDPTHLQELSPREQERHYQSLTAYTGWTGKTLIYEANPRNPIWTKKNGVPFQLFAGRPHDMPQMINWSYMNPYADAESQMFENYREYLKRFYIVNADAHAKDPQWRYNGQEWTEALADSILKENYNGFNNMRFEPLEGDSELIYPGSAYESEPVLGEYTLKSGQRITEILSYGQDADILKARLDAMQDPDLLDIDDLSKAVLKLRRAIGYDDFSDSPERHLQEGNFVVPFYMTKGVPRSTRAEFDALTPKDWQLLVDNEIVTRVETDPLSGFYAWANPETAGGRFVEQAWQTGEGEKSTVTFEVAQSAGALVNWALLNLEEPIDKRIAEAKYRYAIAKDTMERMHTWHPGMVEIGKLESKVDAIYASKNVSSELSAQRERMNAEYAEIVRREIERRNNPVYKFLHGMQALATNLLMRLSWASQIGTFHNPVHRVQFVNFAKGVVDDLSNPEDRERMHRLGVYHMEVADMVGLTVDNVSQEKLGFNQKMLGASKYFSMNPKEYGGMVDFLRAFYNRGNWTPFVFMERRLRGTAAAGGKHLVKDVLTELLIPGKIELTGSALAARRRQNEFALRELDVTIPTLLDAVLELKNPDGSSIRWTEELIDRLTELPERAALATFEAEPHLAAVSKLTDRVMQVLPDYAHYAGSNMHRMRVLDHPFLRLIVLFQTMMIEQTRNIVKMLRYNYNRIVMPAKAAAEAAGKDGLSISQATRLVAPEIWRSLPHFFFSAAAIIGSGFVATMLADLVRGRAPDDEDLAVSTWMINAAVFGAATGYVESAGHYRGLERQIAGPLAGLIADFVQQPGKTAWFYGGRPYPVDFRPLIGYWIGNTPHDLTRSVAAGGFAPTSGTSLSAVRAQ